MVEFESWVVKAQEKLEQESKKVNGSKEKAMAKAVATALSDFCGQDREFAQAVCQGGSFQQCMTEVAKGVGTCISDLEAYKKAVQFYFPGAEIHMQMRIDLIGRAEEQEDATKQGGILLNLEDFL